MRSFSEDLVSIIIPNHGRNLVQTLSSIYCSIYNSIEIVLVDENKERSTQRNKGFENSTGKYLLFLDSDMTIHSYLIAECVELMDKYDGLYIPEIIVGHPIKTFFRNFYTGTRIDAIRFIKREFWQPFDETLTGVEDWDWDRRFKGKKGVVYTPLYHYPKGNFFRKLYYFKWIKAYKQKYPYCPELTIKYRLKLILGGIWKKHLS